MKMTLVTCCVGLGIILAGYVKTTSDQIRHDHLVSKITDIR